EGGKGVVFPDERAIGGVCAGRQLLELLARTRRRLGLRDVRKCGEQRRGERRLQIGVCEPREPVLEGDRLSLLRQLEPSGRTCGRRREDRGVGRTAATTRTAAATVKDRQLDAPARGERGQRL